MGVVKLSVERPEHVTAAVNLNTAVIVSIRHQKGPIFQFKCLVGIVEVRSVRELSAPLSPIIRVHDDRFILRDLKQSVVGGIGDQDISISHPATTVSKPEPLVIIPDNVPHGVYLNDLASESRLISSIGNEGVAVGQAFHRKRHLHIAGNSSLASRADNLSHGLSSLGYMYPNFRILSMAFSLSCRLPSRSPVCSRSCSHAGISLDFRLVVFAPRDRYPCL